LVERQTMSFSIESKLGDLLDNDATKAILEKHMPGISTHPQVSMGKGFALSMVAEFSGGLITEDILVKVNADLSALGRWRGWLRASPKTAPSKKPAMKVAGFLLCGGQLSRLCGGGAPVSALCAVHGIACRAACRAPRPAARFEALHAFAPSRSPPCPPIRS